MRTGTKAGILFGVGGAFAGIYFAMSASGALTTLNLDSNGSLFGLAGAAIGIAIAFMGVHSKRNRSDT